MLPNEIRLSPSGRRVPYPMANVPLSRVLWVDQYRPATGDGSIDNPYNRIQHAYDRIGLPTTLAEAEQAWIINAIVSDMAEPTFPPSRRIIAVIFQGGEVTNQNLGVISWVDDATLMPGLQFGVLVLDGFNAGDIKCLDNGSAATSILFLQGTNLPAGTKIDGTQHVAGILVLSVGAGKLGSGELDCDIDMPAGVLDSAEDTPIRGNVSLANYRTIQNCNIGQGNPPQPRTWTISDGNSQGPTQGFFGCHFEGPSMPPGFTIAMPAAPAGQQYVKMDADSNYTFNQCGVITGGGGATRKLIVTKGIVYRDHSENDAGIVLAQQPAESVLATSGLVPVNMGEQVNCFARVMVENAGLPGTLDYLIRATPQLPAPGAPIIVDAVQDNTPVGDTTTTLAATQPFTLLENLYLFELVASKDPAGAAPTVPGAVIAGAQLLVEVSNL